MTVCRAGKHEVTEQNTRTYKTHRVHWSIRRGCFVKYENETTVCLDCHNERRKAIRDAMAKDIILR